MTNFGILVIDCEASSRYLREIIIYCMNIICFFEENGLLCGMRPDGLDQLIYPFLLLPVRSTEGIQVKSTEHIEQPAKGWYPGTRHVRNHGGGSEGDGGYCGQCETLTHERHDRERKDNENQGHEGQTGQSGEDHRIRRGDH